jgi:hypothetical protein
MSISQSVSVSPPLKLNEIGYPAGARHSPGAASPGKPPMDALVTASACSTGRNPRTPADGIRAES